MHRGARGSGGPNSTYGLAAVRQMSTRESLALPGRQSVADQTRSQSAGIELLYANRLRFVIFTGQSIRRNRLMVRTRPTGPRPNCAQLLLEDCGAPADRRGPLEFDTAVRLTSAG